MNALGRERESAPIEGMRRCASDAYEPQVVAERYYDLSGCLVQLPVRPERRPSGEYLDWHGLLLPAHDLRPREQLQVLRDLAGGDRRIAAREHVADLRDRAPPVDQVQGFVGEDVAVFSSF